MKTDNTYCEYQKYRENVRTEIICAENNTIWIYDMVFYGLYKMNEGDTEVENILNFFQIFKNGIFEVRSIVKFENKIMIIPTELDQNWIIYNTETKDIEYKYVIQQKWKTTDAYVMERNLVLLPFSMEDPIVIVDLDKMEVLKYIKWNKEIQKGEGSEYYAWGGVQADSDILFSVYNNKFIVKIENNHIKQYLIDIPYGICSITSYHHEIWLLPTYGNYIYILDFNGKIVDKIQLVINEKIFSASEFIKIIAVGNVIFLLPSSDKEIYIYSKIEKKFLSITPKGKDIESKLQMHENVPYWVYYENNHKIYFLPIKNQFISVDLKTLKWEERDLFLPKHILNYNIKYWEKCIYLINCIFAHGCCSEAELNLKTYANLIRELSGNKKEKRTYIGKKIWATLHV